MVTAFVSLLPVVALLSIVVASASLPHSPDSPIASDRARMAEIQRIRAHFDSVLSELPSHGLSAFSPAREARRAAVFATLRAYSDAGNFPHNYDFADQPTPYFVDRKTGVLCAVAFLLESTGRRDIVDRVAAANNNIFVAELAGDAGLATWLDENGLTLGEAARIQVPYFGDPMPDIIVEPRAGNTVAYSIASAIAIGGSVAASLWTMRGNSDGHRRLSNIAGFVASASSVGLGVAAAGDRTAPRAIAPLSLLAGSVGAYVATRGMLRHNANRAARREAAQPARVGRAMVTPILPISGQNGAGLSMRLSF